MTPSTNSLGSVSFSPGVGGFSPSNPPSLSLVGQLLDNLVANTKYRTVQMYYLDPSTVQLVANAGLKMLGIIYTVPGQDNTALINSAIQVVHQFPDTVIALSCGNEMILNYGLTSSVIGAVSQCVSQLKAAGITLPIGSIDTYTGWCSNTETPCNNPVTGISDLVDWIGFNDYPWYDNTFSGTWSCVPFNQAAQVTLGKHKTLSALYGKPIVLTEFGWPSAPAGSSIMSQPNDITGQQCGVGNDANQKAMIQNQIDLYRMNNLPCNTFEAFRESWKGNGPTSPETEFGFCLGDSPYTCINQPN